MNEENEKKNKKKIGLLILLALIVAFIGIGASVSVATGRYGKDKSEGFNDNEALNIVNEDEDDSGCGDNIIDEDGETDSGIDDEIASGDGKVVSDGEYVSKTATLRDLLSEEQQATLDAYYKQLAYNQLLGAPGYLSWANKISSSNEAGTGSNDNHTSSKPVPTPTATPVPIKPDGAINSKSRLILDKYYFDDVANCGLTGTGFDFTEATERLHADEDHPIIPVRDAATGISRSKKYTIMLYISGTDLETKTEWDGNIAKITGHVGAASYSLDELARSGFDLNNVNVLVCAGGTNRWDDAYMAESGNDYKSCNIYAIDPSAYANNKLDANSMPLLAHFDAGCSNMGAPELLQGFLDFASEYFPADNYGLVLNNHGGGVTGGVCYQDEDITGNAGTPLSPDKLESALLSSNAFNGKDGKLSFIAMDACMMGSSEIAVNAAPYCDYYLGCSEVEVGSISYMGLMDCVNSAAAKAEADNKQLVCDIAKTYFDGYQGVLDHKAVTSEVIADVVVVDSKGIKDFGENFDKIADAILDTKNDAGQSRLWEYCLESLCKISYAADSMGMLSDYKNVNQTGYIDTLGFLNLLRDCLTTAYDDNTGYFSDKERTQIEEIKSLIETAKNTPFVVAGGVMLRGDTAYREDESEKEILSLNDIDSRDWSDQQTYWGRLKGIANSAISLYLPREIIVGGDGGKTDINPISQDYISMGILKSYTELVNEYWKHVKESADHVDVRDLLVAGDGIQYVQAVKAVGDTNVLLQRFYKPDTNETKVEYVKVLFNGDDSNHESSFSYTDVAKTVNELRLYVDKHMKVQTVDEQGEHGEDKDVRLIMGSVNVPLSGMNGTQEALNIQVQTLSKMLAVQAFGIAANQKNSADKVDEQVEPASADANPGWIVDWATVTEPLKGEISNISSVTVKGYTYRTAVGDDETELNSWNLANVCDLVFDMDADGYYKFSKAISSKDADGNGGGEEIEDYEAIGFSHYAMIDEDGKTNYINLEDAANKNSEYYRGFDWFGPIYKVNKSYWSEEEQKNIYTNNICLSIVQYSEDKDKEDNYSYDMLFKRTDEDEQIVFLPTANENTKEENINDAVWAPSESLDSEPNDVSGNGGDGNGNPSGDSGTNKAPKAYQSEIPVMPIESDILVEPLSADIVEEIQNVPDNQEGNGDEGSDEQDTPQELANAQEIYSCTDEIVVSEEDSGEEYSTEEYNSEDNINVEE